MPTPYDRAVRDGFGELYFLATFPALRRLGSRFDQVRESAGWGGGSPDAEQVADARQALAARAEAVEQRLRQDQPDLHRRLDEAGLLDPLRGELGADGGEDVDQLLDEVTAAGVARNPVSIQFSVRNPVSIQFSVENRRQRAGGRMGRRPPA